MSQACPSCSLDGTSSDSRTLVVRSGVFLRKSDQTLQQRFLCRKCGKSFSSATSQLCYRQKKRQLNPLIFQLLASGLSQRRLALYLKTNRKTVVRKFLFLGIHAKDCLAISNHQQDPSQNIEFDDLETFEHSKMKPLSVIMAVESKTRRILGFRVARMPAKGLLAVRSRKKYGIRRDERRLARRELFQELRPWVEQRAVIKSDDNPHYKKDVKELFPQATHLSFLGIRGCVTGQGELKATKYDPLFTLNHTFAMFRANINRLFRRTWNTTKKPDRLSLHISIYALYHNQVLI